MSNNNSNIPQSNINIPNPFYIPEHNDNSQDDNHNSIEFNNSNEQEDNEFSIEFDNNNEQGNNENTSENDYLSGDALYARAVRNGIISENNNIEANNNNQQENNALANSPDYIYSAINVRYEHGNTFSLSLHGHTIEFNVIVDGDYNMTIYSNIILNNGIRKHIRVSGFDTSIFVTDGNIETRIYDILYILNNEQDKMKEFINKILATIAYKENRCMDKYDDGKGPEGGACGATIMNENKDVIGIENINEGLIMA